MPFNVNGQILTNTQVRLYNNKNIVKNGLTLYVDAGLTSSYPGTGTTWTDLTNSGYNGTLINGPSYSTSGGGSIAFDGADDYADTNRTASQIGMYDASYTAFSICYPTNFSGDKNMIGTDQTLFRQGLHLTFRSGQIYMGHYSSDYAAGYGVLNTWNFITFRFDVSTGAASIFKEAVLQGTGTISSFIGTTNILIAREFGGGYNFQGNIAVTMIYNRALSDSEILQNYQAQRQRFGV